jgi:predicted house-cleaning NTP pyrophosphatase (Maf/HAM1 superfamily)
MTVVLIGFRIWGKGSTLQQAYERLRKANGNRAVKGPVLVYACSDTDVYVSDDSMICYGPKAKLYPLGKLPR